MGDFRAVMRALGQMNHLEIENLKSQGDAEVERLLLSAKQLLLEERPLEASQEAQQALTKLRSDVQDPVLEGAALVLLVESLLDQDAETSALEQARDAVAYYQQGGNVLLHILSQELLAQCQLVRENLEQAMEAVNHGLALTRKAQEYFLEGALLLTGCLIQVKQKDYEEALALAEDAVEVFESLDNEAHAQVAAANYAVGNVLVLLGYAKDAQKEASKARAVYAQRGETFREAICLLLISMAQAMAQSRTEALETATLAREMCLKADVPKGESFALQGLVELCRGQQDYEKALDFAKRRRALTVEVGLQHEVLKAIYSLTHILQERDDLKEAGRAVREGLRLARAMGDQGREALLLMQATQINLSNVVAQGGAGKVSRNLIEETTRLAKDAVSIAKSGVMGGRLRGPALFRQAEALCMTDIPAALATAIEAAECFERSGDVQSETHTTLLIAQVHSRNGDRDKAEEVARSTLVKFEELKDKNGMQMTQSLLSQLSGQKSQSRQQDAEVEQKEVSAAAKTPTLSAEAVRDKIMAIAKQALSDEDVITDDTPLMDSGMDSLSSVSFRNEVQDVFKAKLPASLVFDYPSVGAITAHVLSIAG